jgi:thioredoxin-related protein
MKSVAALLLFVPLSSQSQNTGEQFSDSVRKGILFENGLTWDQTLAKAKAENKYIFLDCYTTWCAPCKRMEREVYPLQIVGEFFNEKFISVKLQMDRTTRDNAVIIRRYNLADSIKAQYLVDAYPTFLFFSSEGKAVHRVAGAFSAEEFINLGKDALDPNKQSYALEARYAEEKRFVITKMTDAELKQMSVSLKNSNPVLADKMALEFVRRLKNKASFKENYMFVGQFSKNPEIAKIAETHINGLSEAELLELFTTENFSFISQFINSYDKRAFKFLFRNEVKIDSLMNKDYEYKLWHARMFINSIIRKTEVSPLIQKAEAMPDWEKLFKSIKTRFNVYYANMNVLQGKIDWYAKNKNWPNYTKHLVNYVDRFAADLQNSWYLNSYAWKTFLYSKEKKELERALAWSGKAILNGPNANWMDTYANLLYKLGRVRLAILWEEKATIIDPNDKDIQLNLEKMNKGQVTWDKY